MDGFSPYRQDQARIYLFEPSLSLGLCVMLAWRARGHDDG
jgi:hypothetical protein